MAPLSICINTQTPLVQFLRPPEGNLLDQPERDATDLTTLQEGVDYRFSPGGVTRMVYPLVRRLIKDGVIDEAHWIALNPKAPGTVRIGPMTLHNVTIDSEKMAGYGEVKEAIWGRIHDISPAEPHDDGSLPSGSRSSTRSTISTRSTSTTSSRCRSVTCSAR